MNSNFTQFFTKLNIRDNLTNRNVKNTGGNFPRNFLLEKLRNATEWWLTLCTQNSTNATQLQMEIVDVKKRM